MRTPPPIPWIESHTPLPAPETAQPKGTELEGLVAAGGGLSVSRLCEAYSQGMFPWFSEGQPELWWSPDPRMVLQVDQFKLHRSLRKTLQQFIRSPHAEIRIDSAFGQVIRHCAGFSRPGQNGTWIVQDMVQAYEALHAAGYAHSVETWVDGQLVGGLYCVAIGQAVFGESMFALKTDASKIALAALVAFAKKHQIAWIDCQQNTKHLASLGAFEIPRSQLLANIRVARQEPALAWEFQSIYWNELMPPKHSP